MPEGTNVLFVGFTEDVGEFTSNRASSGDRAAHIMREVQAWGSDRVANVELASTGFSEIAPAAYKKSTIGQAINRRVEV
jgi:phosphate transport system substrate-binding protein